MQRQVLYTQRGKKKKRLKSILELFSQKISVRVNVTKTLKHHPCLGWINDYSYLLWFPPSFPVLSLEGAAIASFLLPAWPILSTLATPNSHIWDKLAFPLQLMVRNMYLQVPILLKRMSPVGQINFVLEIPIFPSSRGLAEVLKMKPTAITCGKRLCFILGTTSSAELLAWNS